MDKVGETTKKTLSEALDVTNTPRYEGIPTYTFYMRAPVILPSNVEIINSDREWQEARMGKRKRKRRSR
ncbi:MAG: hypothetical protein J6Y37_11445 [Paludibacteraceae bacterium]|nr:hypothetical protein [Paludibacteraceae bacterium]